MDASPKMNALQIYSQFLTDAPRVDFWLDRKLCKDTAGSIFFKVSEELDSKVALRLIDRCTQGWLAEWYEEGMNMFADGEGLYFIDGGTQTVKITKGPVNLIVHKPFKVIRIPEVDPNGDAEVVEEVLLTVEYDPIANEVTRKKWDVMEEGWVFA